MGTRQQQGEVAPSPAAPAPLLEVGAGPSCSCKHRSATAGTERVPPVCHGPLGVQHRALGVQHHAPRLCSTVPIVQHRAPGLCSTVPAGSELLLLAWFHVLAAVPAQEKQAVCCSPSRKAPGWAASSPPGWKTPFELALQVSSLYLF